MSALPSLALPAPPPAFKALVPYLQRAEELRNKDPVMSYWCTYHATQIGISLKVRDTPCREFLMKVLDLLEKMKVEIGPSDAVDMEAASAAYVENFALRVFGLADNEDRQGKATRSTAKKFLAAANFLEVLNVFPKSELTETNGEKIRYAKWKAADISKAFREGRKPAAGPAGSEAEPSISEGIVTPPASELSLDTPASTGSNSPPTPTKPVSPSSSSIKQRSTPSPTMNTDDIIRANSKFLAASTPPRVPSEKDLTPGMWSTAATPGGATPAEFPTNERNPSFELSESSTLASQGRAGSTDTINTAKLSSTTLGSYHSTTSSNKLVVPKPVAAPLSPLGIVNGNGNPLPPAPIPSNISLPVTPAPEFKLTPAIIAKTQKHCRFAISSLDYEDVEQARKELRNALATLGG